MKIKIVFLAISLFFMAGAMQAQVSKEDSLALVDLYNSTGGPTWKHSNNWLTTKPLSQWFGVETSANRVFSLNLANNRLKNSLPLSFFTLTNMNILSLSNNELTGTLDSFPKLTTLGNLQLGMNAFTGRIPPALCNLPLYELGLGYNQLTGFIPDSIGKLAQLGPLDLSNNQLQGRIPGSIGNLKNLYFLDLSHNQISGSIPTSITNLTLLGFLYLDHNQLSGPIPEYMGRLYQMDRLFLENNQLSGHIPATLGNMKGLQILYLNDNQLSDTIPASLGNLVYLNYFSLANNKLTGTIPSSFGNLTDAYYVYLDSNRLSGSIPPSLGNMAGTYILDLSYNRLTGAIPDSLVSMDVLNELRLSHNQLSGSLPKNFGRLQLLYLLDASHNHLSDSVNRVYKPGNAGRQPAVNISTNNYTFNGLESLVTVLPAVNDSNQARLPVHTFNGRLSVTAGGTLANNTYAWFKTGRTDSVVVRGDSTFQPSASGNYYARVTNRVVTGLTLQTDTIKYVKPATLKDLTVTVSPNPGRAIITIHGLDDKTDMMTSVSDMTGYVWVRSVSRQQSKVSVDVSRLKAGNYLVTVSDGTTMKTTPFVKE